MTQAGRDTSDLNSALRQVARSVRLTAGTAFGSGPRLSRGTAPYLVAVQSKFSRMAFSVSPGYFHQERSKSSTAMSSSASRMVGDRRGVD